MAEAVGDAVPVVEVVLFEGAGLLAYGVEVRGGAFEVDLGALGALGEVVAFLASGPSGAVFSLWVAAGPQRLPCTPQRGRGATGCTANGVASCPGLPSSSPVAAPEGARSGGGG
ncbi:hypothetical protein SAMN06297387_108206 [Streptomyces zhaozhouensis]|uniref:Uncharacterized protein n=1 Tax=Streptomyces zhaozhouensis TaxID=1300267 RepID=A0A286DWN2_9ACTN|nr:hypothetical protein SAMN06297387_108206 [Streptomyces zhaozhouensis]